MSRQRSRVDSERDHVIGTALFDVVLDGSRTGPDDVEALPAYLRDRFLPVAAEVFDEVAPPGRLLRLDRLEVDLGPALAAGPSLEAEHLFREALWEALLRAMGAEARIALGSGAEPGTAPGVGPGGVAGGSSGPEVPVRTVGAPGSGPARVPRAGREGAVGPDPGRAASGAPEREEARILSLPAGDLAELAHFLRTGTLSWSASVPGGETLDALARRTIAADPDGFAALLKETADDVVVVDRFVRQMSRPTVRAAVRAVAGDDPVAWAGVVDRFEAEVERAGFGAAEADVMRRIFLRELLGALAGGGEREEERGVLRRIRRAGGGLSGDLGTAWERVLDGLADAPAEPPVRGAAPVSGRPGAPGRAEVRGRAAAPDPSEPERSRDAATAREGGSVLDGLGAALRRGDPEAWARRVPAARALRPGRRGRFLRTLLSDPEVRGRIADRFPTPALLELVALLAPDASGVVGSVIVLAGEVHPDAPSPAERRVFRMGILSQLVKVEEGPFDGARFLEALEERLPPRLGRIAAESRRAAGDYLAHAPHPPGVPEEADRRPPAAPPAGPAAALRKALRTGDAAALGEAPGGLLRRAGPEAAALIRRELSAEEARRRVVEGFPPSLRRRLVRIVAPDLAPAAALLTGAWSERPEDAGTSERPGHRRSDPAGSPAAGSPAAGASPPEEARAAWDAVLARVAASREPGLDERALVRAVVAAVSALPGRKRTDVARSLARSLRERGEPEERSEGLAALAEAEAERAAEAVRAVGVRPPPGREAAAGTEAEEEAAEAVDGVGLRPPPGTEAAAAAVEAALLSGVYGTILGRLRGWLRDHGPLVASLVASHAGRRVVRRSMARALPDAALLDVVSLLEPRAVGTVTEVLAAPEEALATASDARPGRRLRAPDGGPALRTELWDHTLAHLILDGAPDFTREGYLRALEARLAAAGRTEPDEGAGPATKDPGPATQGAGRATESTVGTPDAEHFVRGYLLRDALLSALPEPGPEADDDVDVVGELRARHPRHLRWLLSALEAGDEEPLRELARRPPGVLRGVIVALLGRRTDDEEAPTVTGVEADAVEDGASGAHDPPGEPGGAGSELLRAVDALAAGASDPTALYHDVLRHVVEGRLIDLDELGAPRAHETGRRDVEGKVEHGDRPAAEPLDAADAVRILEALSSGEPPEPGTGGAVRGAVEIVLARDPLGSRPLLERALARADSAALLVEALPDATLARVFLLLRPGVAPALLRTADLVAEAALPAWAGAGAAAALGRARWRFLARYLVGEGRLPVVERFGPDFRAFLAERDPAGRPAAEVSREIGSRLAELAEVADARDRDLLRGALDADLGPDGAGTGRGRPGPGRGWGPDAAAADPGSGPDGAASGGESARGPSDAGPADAEPPLGWAFDDEIFITNAGVVLAAPFLPRLFSTLELTEDGSFRSLDAACRAAHLIQYVAEGRADRPEYVLFLNRILCGLPDEEPLPRRIDVTPREEEVVEGMLQSLLAHWNGLGNTSIEGLQQSFFQREGSLRLDGEVWRLQVEERSFDLLLDRVPWNFTSIRFGWMERLLRVEWR